MKYGTSGFTEAAPVGTAEIRTHNPDGSVYAYQIGHQIVNVTTATVTLDADDAGIITLNRAGGIAVTLPAASGTGVEYTMIIGTTFTGSATIKVVGNDIMTGHAIFAQDSADTAVMFETAADTDTITFDGTTTGGYKGTRVRLIDIAADLWFVEVVGSATSAEATPFSATVTP